tara:strand:+ start:3592 stop:6054 length:2463 start_codon:yes stop_codon:yes gene_type:complete
MPKVSKAFSSFTSGEITPRLFGRTDIAKYDTGAETVENFIVQPHGGLTRRPGTRFVAEVKNSANAVRLIPFQFNVEQSYVLEFGPSYFRIYKDGGQVESGGSAVEVATPYAAGDLDGLKYAQVADIMYVTSPSHAPRKITRTSHTAWTITEVSLARGPFGDLNITDTTLTCSAATGSITVTASADTFVSTDVGRLIKTQEGFVKITGFTSATVVTGTVQELEDGRTELLPSYTATTISFHEGDPDSTGLEHNDRIEDTAAQFVDEGFKKGQTVTLAGSTSNNTTAGFLVVDVTDSVITFAPGADLTAEAAGDTVTVAGKLIASDEWQLGAFSATTGYPRACTFYEQRLVMAGTDDQPQTLFFSQSDDFENFEAGAEADDAMVYTIGSNEVNVIRFLASTRNMIVGTSGGEFVVRAGSTDEAITPTNIQIKQQTAHGASDHTPIQAGNAVLFIQRAKRKIRELQYNFDTDGYIAPDITLISEHATEGGITELAYQQEPDSVVWSVRADGQLTTTTYKREEQVIGWARQVIGGTDVVVERIATIPGDLDEDQVYMVVRRTINGATKRYIEYIRDFDFGSDVSDARFVDSSLTFTGVTSTLNGAITNSATTIALADASAFPSSGAIKIGTEVITYSGKSTNDLTGCTRGVAGDAAAHASGATVTQASISLSGLAHLEGQTVSVLGDGAVHPDVTVSSAAVTLNRYVTKAHVGLSYNSTLRTLRVDAGSAAGTSQGKTKRINELTVRLYRSVGLQVGRDADNLDVVPFRSSATLMGSAIGLYTGDKDIELNGNYDTDGQITIRQTQPLPMTVLAVYATVSTFDQ